MAQRIAFHYIPGYSPLHRWDGRCKLLGLLMVVATLLQIEIKWLILNSGMLAGLLILSRLPVKRFLRGLWTWAIFLFILLFFHGLFTSGSRLALFPWIPLSKEGLRLGSLVCWRLGLVLVYAILFTAVTRPRELRDALIWFLKPVPFLPERQIGMMVSLTLRFFSLILDEAEEVRLAQKARLGDKNKNPFRKAKFLALPLLRRSFSNVEEITFALAARGFREDLPLLLPKISLLHFAPLFSFLCLSMMIGWLG